MPAQRVKVLGVSISAVVMPDVLDAISDWVRHRDPHYVSVTPAHGVMNCHHNPELRRVSNRNDLTTADGMSLVWLLGLKDHSGVGRVYGPDLLLAACDRFGGPDFDTSSMGVPRALRTSWPSG